MWSTDGSIATLSAATVSVKVAGGDELRHKQLNSRTYDSRACDKVCTYKIGMKALKICVEASGNGSDPRNV